MPILGSTYENINFLFETIYFGIGSFNNYNSS